MTSPRPARVNMAMPSRLPPAPARAAILLGFLTGTWALVEGLNRWITGHGLRLDGYAGPWAAWGVAAAALGALWMVVGNLYLFQNRLPNWKAMMVLVVVSSWFAGWATPVLVAQLVLLLLPATRHALANGTALGAGPEAP